MLPEGIFNLKIKAMNQKLLNSSMISIDKAHTSLQNMANSFSSLSVIETNMTPLIYYDPDIKAVLFDIYGTLLISEAGDIGLTALDQGEDRLFTIESLNDKREIRFNRIKSILLERIKAHHECIKNESTWIQYPEVDIISLWDEVFQILDFREYNADILSTTALNFEVFSNKVWLMPGIVPLFEFFRGKSFLLGIVSNAQFYTPLLFEHLLGKSLKELGFEEKFISWSFQVQCGKPDPRIFKNPLIHLNRMGIENHEILYVGNDMLNDVVTASVLGLKTALFAGDRRSLRMREEDTRVMDISPNYIITELNQLKIILEEGLNEE